VLDSTDYLKSSLRATVAWHRKNGGLLFIWVVMLNLFGGYILRVSALTFNHAVFLGSLLWLLPLASRRAFL